MIDGFFFEFKRYYYNTIWKCYKWANIQTAQIRSKNSEKRTIKKQIERSSSGKREMIYTLTKMFDLAWRHRQHGSPPRPRSSLLLALSGCFCSCILEIFPRLNMLKKQLNSTKKESISQTRKKSQTISQAKLKRPIVLKTSLRWHYPRRTIKETNQLEAFSK